MGLPDVSRIVVRCTAFYSGFIQVPVDGDLILQVRLIQGIDTIAAAELQFPTEARYSYRFNLYPARGLPGYGGDVGIPLRLKPSGYPADSVYFRWSGMPIRSID